MWFLGTVFIVAVDVFVVVVVFAVVADFAGHLAQGAIFAVCIAAIREAIVVVVFAIVTDFQWGVGLWSFRLGFGFGFGGALGFGRRFAAVSRAVLFIFLWVTGAVVTAGNSTAVMGANEGVFRFVANVVVAKRNAATVLRAIVGRFSQVTPGVATVCIHGNFAGIEVKIAGLERHELQTSDKREQEPVRQGFC